MEAEAGANNAGWAEVTSAEYAAAIRSSLQVETEGEYDVYIWTCPRCKHAASNRFLHKGLTTDMAEVETAPERQTITLTCGCGLEHADQPDDNLWPGCGCYAVALIEVPE